jgi:hypothetical protein
MSYTDSNLSPTHFDYVVAVTQDSINGALKENLYAGEQEVIVCYAYDTSNPPVLGPIDHAALVTAAHGTDPFSVPAGTLPTDQRVQNLANAGFAFAIKAQLGLPPGVPPADLPPIVTLKSGQSNVTYTLTFAEFAVAELTYGPRNSLSWYSDAQPANTAWTFSAIVDLDFQDASFTSLSQAVQARLTGLGPNPAIFSIKQLYYDLNNADLIQGWNFDGLPTGTPLTGFMAQNFVLTYFKNLQGGEVLGAAAVQATGVTPGSLWLTDVNFFTPDAYGSVGAPLTLNYLCAAGGDPLPGTPSPGFSWNWIDPGEQFDGVAALNRNTLASYLNAHTTATTGSLENYVTSNCYVPTVSVPLNSGSIPQYNYTAVAGQLPTVNFPSSGNTLIQYSHSADSSDQAGLNGDLGQLEVSTSFDLTVSFQGSQLVIDQHLVFYLRLQHLTTQVSGNVVDKTIVDTYSMGVDDNGQLVVALLNSTPTDNSQSLDVNAFVNFFTAVNYYSDTIAQWAQNLAHGHLTDVPVSLIGQFVFPGNSAFTFADATFSANGDLVSHINYVSSL